jgi:hypothetical protein
MLDRGYYQCVAPENLVTEEKRSLGRSESR